MHKHTPWKEREIRNRAHALWAAEELGGKARFMIVAGVNYAGAAMPHERPMTCTAAPSVCRARGYQRWDELFALMEARWSALPAAEHAKYEPLAVKSLGYDAAPSGATD